MSATTPRPPSLMLPAGVCFWLRWVAASAIGALPGLALAYAYAAVAGDSLAALPGGQSGYTGWATVVLLLAPGAFLGLGTGIAQMLASARWLRPTWLLANVAGYSVLWCGIVAADRFGVFRFEQRLLSIILLGLLTFAIVLCLVLPQRVLLGRLYPEEWLDWVFGDLVVSIVIVGCPVIVLALLLQGVWKPGLSLPAVGVLVGAVSVQVVAAGLALQAAIASNRSRSAAGLKRF